MTTASTASVIAQVVSNAVPAARVAAAVARVVNNTAASSRLAQLHLRVVSGSVDPSPAAGSSTGAGSVVAHTLRVLAADPSEDLVNSGWSPSTGTDLYPMVTPPPDGDNTYIFCHSAGATCRVGLAYTPAPGDLDGYEAHFQLLGDGTSGITIKLMQGASVIRTWTYDPAPTDWTTVVTPLSAGEVASITDPTQLRYELTEV
jgi:hypothetical protein